MADEKFDPSEILRMIEGLKTSHPDLWDSITTGTYEDVISGERLEKMKRNNPEFKWFLDSLDPQ